MKVKRFLPMMLTAVIAGCQPGSEQPDDTAAHQTAPSINNLEKAANMSLFDAVEQGDISLILQLLDDGADMNATDQQGRTPLMIAVHTNRLDVFKLFIEKGANINIQDHLYDNPLLYAGAEGLLPFVKASLEAGADTTITNRFGGTALIPAADRGHVAVVKELLTSSDVNINHVNNLGWTALLEAIILGDGGADHQAVVTLLIEHGADVNLPDYQGITPLQHAKGRGFTEMIEALEQAGAR